MHLRVSTRRTPGRVYRYAQVVQSFRRDDGMPAHRVVANLGALSQPQIDALRLAFRAGAKGEALVLESEVADLLAGSTRANRRYLDLAVLLDCWQRWELSALLDGLLDKQATSLSLAEVVLPLVLQRCSAPGSKLEAVGWLPKTALPELLGLDISAFHNSRIHRALDTLYEVTGPLQEVLHERYQDRDGTYGALFMDVTDTYFEGIGCPMAELTKTKTEMPHKRCLGIVLLANERGYPVRWKVVGGKTKDWHAMGGLLEDIGQVPWLKQTPVVFDRAMGNQKTVRALKQAKVRFVTAAHVTEIESYSKKVPISALADIVLDGSSAPWTPCCAPGAWGHDRHRVHHRGGGGDPDPQPPGLAHRTAGAEPGPWACAARAVGRAAMPSPASDPGGRLPVPGTAGSRRTRLRHRAKRLRGARLRLGSLTDTITRRVSLDS